MLNVAAPLGLAYGGTDGLRYVRMIITKIRH